MFVRWKRRERSRRKRLTGEIVLSAALVESTRVDGKPRQRYIKYLGTIRERWTGAYWHQHDFWKRAEQNLDSLDLSAVERGEIERALLAIVPRPDAIGLAGVEQELRKHEAQL